MLHVFLLSRIFRLALRSFLNIERLAKDYIFARIIGDFYFLVVEEDFFLELRNMFPFCTLTILFLRIFVHGEGF